MEPPFVLHPTDKAIPPVMGLAKLGKLRFDGVDLAPIWQQLASRYADDNSDSAALMDLCLIDQMHDNAARGLVLQEHALSLCRLYQFPAKTSPPRLRIVGFATAGNISANTPIEFLIEDSDIIMYVVYIVPGMPLPPIPEHDLAFVLVSESEESREVLQELERIVVEWPRPVINLPSLIPKVGREQLYKVLSHVSSIVIPATVRVDMSALVQLCDSNTPAQLCDSNTLAQLCDSNRALKSILPDGEFPLIIRPFDSHAGHGLAKIDDVDALTVYLSTRMESDFYISRFLDYRSADGLFRKYRIAVIEGKAFPSHMGISDNWMIHYVNAGMLESAEKRAEEELFMNQFSEQFGRRHQRAIAEMADLLQLEYFGIDCGETPDGKLLIFEADNALVVHNMDQPEIFPYKGPHMVRVFSEFREMMVRKVYSIESNLNVLIGG